MSKSRRPTGAVSGKSEVRLSVIAPCFNEQANVNALADRTLAAFESLNVAAELVLVDDGSADGTWTTIRERALDDDRVRGVRHAQNRGIVVAWWTGLSVARGQLVCLIDADLQNRPEDICLLYDYYLRGTSDIVQAVRHPARTGERCRVFTRGLNFLLNAAFRTRLRDNKSGFILCRRDILARVLSRRWRYRYYQCFIGVAAKTRGLTIGEVDTAFDLRHAGTSFLPQRPLRVSVQVLAELVKFRLETWLISPTTTARSRRAAVPCQSPLAAVPSAVEV